jgi:hypothetical protein
MSQGALSVASGSGIAVRTGFNDAIARLASRASGTSRPSDIVAGEEWIETDNPGAGIQSLWRWDGTTDILQALINTTTHAITWYQGGSAVLTSASLPIANGAGTVDAITADFSPDVTIADNLLVVVVSPGVNTISNPTLSADGNTARTIKRAGGQALILGDTGPAGNTMFLRYEATGTYWELLNPRMTVNRASTTAITSATGTTTIPLDNTIPQSSEGNQYFTVTLNRKSANSRIRGEVIFFVTGDTNGQWATVAVFQDSATDAFAVGWVQWDVAHSGRQVVIRFDIANSAAGDTTFKVRAGPHSSGTIRLNGVSGSEMDGGTLASGIWVEEYNL